MRSHVKAVLVLLVGVVGCGSEPELIEETPLPARELPQPVLRMVAPTSISAGAELSVLGEGFADPGIGTTRLMFEGTYLTTSGQSYPVRLEAAPRFVNQGMVSWTFGPNIPFASAEDTGQFRGHIRALNIGRDGQTKQAREPIPAQLQVLPSIIIRQMRPAGSGCRVGITDTTESSPFVFELKAVGLKNGTNTAPLRFVYSFLKEHFQITGFLSDQLAVDPAGLFPKSGPVSLIDDVLDGSVSVLGAGAARKLQVVKSGFNPGLASIPAAAERLFGLTQLTTAPLPSVTTESYDAAMTVVAIDSRGQTARRTIPLRVWSPVEVDYDGRAEVVRSFDPVPVSGCLPGGPIGLDVSYTEQSTQTLNRAFSVRGSLGGGFDVKVARLNAEFGMDVQGSVSSSDAKSLSMAVRILPKEFGAFYRQTLQLERRAKLKLHSACGDAVPAGEVVVTDWVWSPDLGKGRSCPPLPKSNLPAGQLFRPVQ